MKSQPSTKWDASMKSNAQVCCFLHQGVQHAIVKIALGDWISLTWQGATFELTDVEFLEESPYRVLGELQVKDFFDHCGYLLQA